MQHLGFISKANHTFGPCHDMVARRRFQRAVLKQAPVFYIWLGWDIRFQPPTRESMARGLAYFRAKEKQP